MATGLVPSQEGSFQVSVESVIWHVDVDFADLAIFQADGLVVCGLTTNSASAIQQTSSGMALQADVAAAFLEQDVNTM